MKILAISNYYPPEAKGGYEKALKLLLDGLVASGDEVTVLAGTGVPEEDRLLFPYPLHGREKPGVRARVFAAWRSVENARLAIERVRRDRPDVCLAANILELSRLPVEAIHNEGVPVVRFLSDADLVEPYRAAWSRSERALSSLLHLRNDAAVRMLRLARTPAASTSRFIERTFNAASLLGPARVIVRPSVVTQDRPRAVLPGRTILSTSGLREEKGVFDLVEAFATVAPRCPEARLVLTGHATPEIASLIAEQLRESAIADRIRLAGLLDEPELDRLHAECAIFVMPSRMREAVSLSTAEAMASGNAVVSTALGGNGEILRDGENALVVPPGDAAALASALERLLADDELQRRLAEEGVATARLEHDRDIMVSRLRAFLIESVASYAGGGFSTCSPRRMRS